MNILLNDVDELMRMSRDKAEKNHREALSYIENDIRGIARIIGQYSPLEILRLSKWEANRLKKSKNESSRLKSVFMPVFLQSLISSDEVELPTSGNREVKPKDWDRIQYLVEDIQKKLLRLIDAKTVIEVGCSRVDKENAAEYRNGLLSLYFPRVADKDSVESDYEILFYSMGSKEEALLPSIKNPMDLANGLYEISESSLEAIDRLKSEVDKYNSEMRDEISRLKESGNYDYMDENDLRRKVIKKKGWEDRVNRLSGERNDYDLFRPDFYSNLTKDDYYPFSAEMGKLDFSKYFESGILISTLRPFIRIGEIFFTFVGEELLEFSPRFISDVASLEVNGEEDVKSAVNKIFTQTGANTYSFKGINYEIYTIPSLALINPISFPLEFNAAISTRKAILNGEYQGRVIIVDPDLRESYKSPREGLCILSSRALYREANRLSEPVVLTEDEKEEDIDDIDSDDEELYSEFSDFISDEDEIEDENIDYSFEDEGEEERELLDESGDDFNQDEREEDEELYDEDQLDFLSFLDDDSQEPSSVDLKEKESEDREEYDELDLFSNPSDSEKEREEEFADFVESEDVDDLLDEDEVTEKEIGLPEREGDEDESASQTIDSESLESARIDSEKLKSEHERDPLFESIDISEEEDDDDWIEDEDDEFESDENEDLDELEEEIFEEEETKEEESIAEDDGEDDEIEILDEEEEETEKDELFLRHMSHSQEEKGKSENSLDSDQAIEKEEIESKAKSNDEELEANKKANDLIERESQALEEKSKISSYEDEDSPSRLVRESDGTFSLVVEKRVEDDYKRDILLGIKDELKSPSPSFDRVLANSDRELLDYLRRVFKECWKKQRQDHKDKIFTIYEGSLSVLMARSPIRDELRLSELLNNAGAIMYSQKSDNWSALVLYIDEHYEVESAREYEISKSFFSQSDWKRIINMGEALRERIKNGMGRN